jgi:hypothetical protein
MAAFPEQLLRMRFLEIAQPDFGGGDLGGDGKYRHMTAMAVEQAVDQVQIARTAASRANRKRFGDSGLGTGREGCHFLMTNMHPVNFSKPSWAIVEPVQAISGYAPNPFNAGVGERLSQKIRDCRFRNEVILFIVNL